MRFSMIFVVAARLAAQADMSQMDHSHHTESTAKTDCMCKMDGMGDMKGMQHAGMDHGGMDHSGMLAGAPMTASGTSLNPAATPMDMLHFRAGRWNFAVHGQLFLTEIQQTGPRGSGKLASINWAMAEASHELGGGTFSVRTMLSLEPLTVTGRRYPELFQTGETAYGKAIVDGQHPHDFVMELALQYSHSLGTRGRYWLYAAPVGDPALGPAAFPHRASAAELPQATLGHHLQDSTHVSNEVVTAGVSRGIFGFEASGFHGGEPNENRWNIDHGGMESYSARVTVTPNARWTGQVSAGRLARPEALESGDQVRISASATNIRPYRGGEIATSLIWGRVHKTGSGDNLNGYLVESVARFRQSNYVTGRIEFDDKDELGTGSQALRGRIGAYTLGYTRDFPLVGFLRSGLGANFTTYSMAPELHKVYGQHPVAAMVFLRLRLRAGGM
jgi:hypothetical protein